MTKRGDFSLLSTSVTWVDFGERSMIEKSGFSGAEDPGIQRGRSDHGLLK
jgi:hypothetical protein